LLERWLSAHHDWRPATWIGARSNVKALRPDGISARRVSTLKPEHVRAAMASWSAAGASVAVISGRFRSLRSAIGWAHVERIIDVNPLWGMRGPTRPGTRLHLSSDEILRLLDAADGLVASTEPEDAGRRHKAEQIRLLVRLAADSGARRGELVALRFEDLEDRVLTIERGVSADVLGPTKTGRTRRLTLGRRTAELWRSSAQCWADRLPEGGRLGPWLFSPRLRTTSDSLRAPSATGSPSSPAWPRSQERPCTICATASWDEASCCEPSSDSGTPGSLHHAAQLRRGMVVGTNVHPLSMGTNVHLLKSA
jgi:integrase